MVIICSYLKHVQYGEERVDFMLVTCITSVFEVNNKQPGLLRIGMGQH